MSILLRKSFSIIFLIALLLNVNLVPSYAVLIPTNIVNVEFSSREIPNETSVIWGYTASSGQALLNADLELQFTSHYSSALIYGGIYADNSPLVSYNSYRVHDGEVKNYSFKNINAKKIKIELRTSDSGWVRVRLTSNSKIDIGALVAGEATETYALEAKNAANQAKTSADTASTNALNANTNANAAKNMLNGSSNGGRSLAATYDRANASSQDTTYIRNTQLPGTENRLSNKIDDIETSLGNSISTNINSLENNIGDNISSTETSINSNISNLEDKIALLEGNITEVINDMDKGDTTPPNFADLKTKSGARATSGSSIQLVVDATDNISSTLQYSVDGGSFQPLPSNRVITASVGSGPIATISVTVKDEAGNESSKSISIRKL